MGPTGLRPTTALWTLGLLSLTSFGAAVVLSINTLMQGEGSWAWLAMTTAIMLVVNGVSLLMWRRMPYYLSGGALMITTVIATATAAEANILRSWGVFFLCLYPLILGGRLLVAGTGLDAGNGNWSAGDRMVVRSLLREGVRTAILVGSAFLVAALLLSLVGYVTLEEFPLMLLATLSILTLVMIYLAYTAGPESES